MLSKGNVILWFITTNWLCLWQKSFHWKNEEKHKLRLLDAVLCSVVVVIIEYSGLGTEMPMLQCQTASNIEEKLVQK